MNRAARDCENLLYTVYLVCAPSRQNRPHSRFPFILFTFFFRWLLARPSLLQVPLGFGFRLPLSPPFHQVGFQLVERYNSSIPTRKGLYKDGCSVYDETHLDGRVPL